MLYNNIKIAWRNLLRYKVFSVIHIFGLALGIAVFLLIAQYTVSEWSANRFHSNFEKLYRVNVIEQNGSAGYILPPGYAPMLAGKLAGVEQITRVADGIGSGALSVAATSNSSEPASIFREESISYVDSSFLQVFSFKVVQGTSQLPANTMAISAYTSTKLFGKENAVGKPVQVSNQFGNTTYTVAAVFADMPEQSDIKANVLLSFHTLENPANRDGNDWADPNKTESGFATLYMLLQPGADGNAVSQQLTAFAHGLNEESRSNQVVLQPFKHLHLAPGFNYTLHTFGNLLLVVVFSGIGLLILLIAWINYINLSTAQAIQRHKEVGVRKVLGASRLQLCWQYLCETALVTLASFALALILVQLLQPLFNNFTSRQLTLGVLNKAEFLGIGAGILLTGAILSGSYVAFVISGYQPVKSLRGQVEKTVSGFTLRKALVVFQFTVSIIFIIATLVLYRQLQYMNSQQLGMNLNQLVVIKGPTVATDDQAEKNVAFKNQLAQLPFITRQAASNNVPGNGYNFSANGITKTTAAANDEKKSYSMFICDENFLPTYGIQLVQGRNFTNEEANRGWSNAGKVMLNEKAARELGFDLNTNITGQNILWGKPYEVVGVIKDYHHLSLREAIKPAVYLPSVSFVYFTVQMDVSNFQAKLAAIKKLYKANFGSNPFDYFFADEQYNNQYQAEQKLGNVFIAASLVAVCIAGMGLFGLATLAARQRTKEIGIRKVLGADVAGIVALIAKDFIILLAIAMVIASPVAWWIMQAWLQNFAYKTNVSWWIFLLAGTTTVLIASLSIGYQAMKAALANPVQSLRQTA